MEIIIMMKYIYIYIIFRDIQYFVIMQHIIGEDHFILYLIRDQNHVIYVHLIGIQNQNLRLYILLLLLLNQKGNKIYIADKCSINQCYVYDEKNSLYIIFYIFTSTVPAPPEIPICFSSYIGNFLDDDEENDDNTTTVLVMQNNNIIYYDEDSCSIKNETLTNENCKELLEKKYCAKINKNEVIYRDVLPCYRCYEVSLQSMIESYLYDCSIEKRECKCKKKSKKLACIELIDII